jgi:hypothetical protein
MWATRALPVLGLALTFFGANANAQSADQKIQFISEYVRELSAQEQIRAEGEKELAEAPNQEEQLTASIHAATRMQLELQTQIAMLKSFHFDSPFDVLVRGLTSTYQEKINLYQELADICSDFIGDPKPGVDYGKLTAEMPKVRAYLEDNEKGLLPITAVAFGMLIDERPDSKNHASHLLITKAQKSQLLRTLAAGFGEKLDQKDPNYVVGSALLLKSYLTKGFKCADEPWE